MQARTFFFLAALILTGLIADYEASNFPEPPPRFRVCGMALGEKLSVHESWRKKDGIYGERVYKGVTYCSAPFIVGLQDDRILWVRSLYLDYGDPESGGLIGPALTDETQISTVLGKIKIYLPGQGQLTRSERKEDHSPIWTCHYPGATLRVECWPGMYSPGPKGYSAVVTLFPDDHPLPLLEEPYDYVMP